MESLIVRCDDENGIDDSHLLQILKRSLEGKKDIKKVLLIPPDNTRAFSKGNTITNMYFNIFDPDCHVDILPALGTHMALSDKELIDFFGDKIPLDRYIEHNWRTSAVKIGEIPASYVSKVSGGKMSEPIDVNVHKSLVGGEYDLIISIGRVTPHEVLGMSNYSKNIFIGCGGHNMICKTHVLGPLCDVENKVGVIDNPVRKVLDYAHEKFLSDIPLMFVMTVTTLEENELTTKGVYIGDKREVFEAAAADSQRYNIIYLDRPVKKLITHLSEKEFKSTWLGDKAVQKTRTIIEDGGEVIILAPGIRQFGDDPQLDKLIRKYGYIPKGDFEVIISDEKNTDIRDDLVAACQLMVTSSNDRFKITYAVRHLSREEIEGVNFSYMDYDEAVRTYDPDKLDEGYNLLDNGEEVYFIRDVEAGYWTIKK